MGHPVGWMRKLKVVQFEVMAKKLYKTVVFMIFLIINVISKIPEKVFKFFLRKYDLYYVGNVHR